MSDDTPALAWNPGPALAQAIAAALSQLAVTWPRALPLAGDQSDAGREFAASYAYAMRGGIDLRAIPVATREWVATQKFAPKPAELAEYARTATRKHFPRIEAPRPDVPAEVPPTTKDFAKIDILSRRAFETLQSWRLVGEVWSLLVYLNKQPDLAQATRDGNVPYDVFDTAVTAVQSGQRAPTGPLGLGRAA